jgi:hypothetical protein
MALKTDEVAETTLVTGREPKSPKASDKSMGGQAFNDALLIVLSCWAIVILLWLSVRSHNV